MEDPCYDNVYATNKKTVVKKNYHHDSVAFDQNNWKNRVTNYKNRKYSGKIIFEWSLKFQI